MSGDITIGNGVRSHPHAGDFISGIGKSPEDDKGLPSATFISMTAHSEFMVTIETGRLVLREFTLDDYEAAHAYALDPRVVEYMSFGPNTPDDTRRFLERAIEKQRQSPRTGYTLALTIGGELIGGCGVTVTDAKLGEGEIGYCMRPEHWGQA